MSPLEVSNPIAIAPEKIKLANLEQHYQYVPGPYNVMNKYLNESTVELNNKKF